MILICFVILARLYTLESYNHINIQVRLKSQYSRTVSLVKPVQLVMDLTQVHYSDMIRTICSIANINIDDVALVWCSPPCTTNSPMNKVNTDQLILSSTTSSFD